MTEQDKIDLHIISERAERLSRTSIDFIIAMGTPLAIGILSKVAGHEPEPALTNAMAAETIAAGTVGFVRLLQVEALHWNRSEDQWSVQLNRAENRGMDAIEAAARTVSLQVRHLARTLTRKSHISS